MLWANHPSRKRARAWCVLMLPCPCPRCGDIIMDGMAWDVGHIFDIDTHPELAGDPDNWRPEHASCNRADGARKRNRKHKTRPATSRRWL